MQNSFFLRMMVLVAVFTLFSPGKIYAAICQQRYPSDSEECHFVQSTERDAKRGDVSAQFYLGVAYFYGEGVPQDYRQAVYWFHEGKKEGYAPGQLPSARLIIIPVSLNSAIPKTVIDKPSNEKWRRWNIILACGITTVITYRKTNNWHWSGIVKRLNVGWLRRKKPLRACICVGKGHRRITNKPFTGTPESRKPSCHND